METNTKRLRWEQMDRLSMRPTKKNNHCFFLRRGIVFFSCPDKNLLHDNAESDQRPPTP